MLIDDFSDNHSANFFLVLALLVYLLRKVCQKGPTPFKNIAGLQPEFWWQAVV